jgi:hypothetical protein
MFLRCRRGWSCCGRGRGLRLRCRSGSGCCLRRFPTIAGDEAGDSQRQTKCVYDFHGNVLFPAESFMMRMPSLGNSPDRRVRVFTDVLAEMNSSAATSGEVFRILPSAEYGDAARRALAQSHPHSHAPKLLPRPTRAPCLRDASYP